MAKRCDMNNCVSYVGDDRYPAGHGLHACCMPCFMSYDSVGGHHHSEACSAFQETANEATIHFLCPECGDRCEGTEESMRDYVCERCPQIDALDGPGERDV